MRKMTTVLFGLVVLFGTTEIWAEHPHSVACNRYWGLCWGDGYHVHSNVCNGYGCAPQYSYQGQIQAPVAPAYQYQHLPQPQRQPQPLPAPAAAMLPRYPATVPSAMAPPQSGQWVFVPNSLTVPMQTWNPQVAWQYQPQPPAMFMSPVQSAPIYVARVPAGAAVQAAQPNFPRVSIP